MLSKELKIGIEKEIKKSNTTINNIKKVNIIQNRFNTGEYMTTWNEDGFKSI